MNDKRTCGNCRWWLDEKDGAGQCHQDTPAVDVIGPKYPTWPVTDYNHWCGKWRDKSITPEQEQRAELVTRFAVAIVGSDYDGPGARFEPDTIWRMAAEYVDARPTISHAICDGCNTKLPPNVQRLCPECAKTLDALSEYVKQRSEVSRER